MHKQHVSHTTLLAMYSRAVAVQNALAYWTNRLTGLGRDQNLQAPKPGRKAHPGPAFVVISAEDFDHLLRALDKHAKELKKLIP